MVGVGGAAGAPRPGHRVAAAGAAAAGAAAAGVPGPAVWSAGGPAGPAAGVAAEKEGRRERKGGRRPNDGRHREGALDPLAREEPVARRQGVAQPDGDGIEPASAAASLSIWASWAKQTWTAPKPRIAPQGGLFVRTAERRRPVALSAPGRGRR